MPNPFAKGWKQLMAGLDRSIDENADPKVQIHQAMTGAKHQHKAVTEQAAAVIGDARRLEIDMGTKGRRIDELQGQVRQALQVAESTRAKGDEAGAARLESQAEQLAAQLVTAEQDLENTRGLHSQAVQAAEDAKRAVAQSERQLEEALAHEDQLLLQADQAEMQHRTSDAMASLHGGAVGGNSPTLDEVRSTIESRYTTALGRQELAESQGAASSAQVDAAALTREAEGRAKLDQIRAQMGLPGGTDSSTPRLPRDTPGQAPE